MGIGFVAFAWVVIILICQIILSPLTIIGFKKYKKLNNKKWLIFCVPAISLLVLPFVVTILAGTSIILGDHGPIKRPLEKDVYGKYYLTEKSRNYLNSEKHYQAIPDTVALEFDPSGKLFMVNMPDCLFNGFGDSNGEFISKTEIWEISDANWIISWLEGWPINYSSISLMGNGPIYYVSIGVGDPDSGEYILFKKKKE